MKTILLCGQDKQEVDCIQVDAIMVKLSDGRTLALTENSLRRAGLENLDATDALPEWMRQRIAEFRAATAQSLTAK